MKHNELNKPTKKQSIEKYLAAIILILFFASAAKGMFSYQESIVRKYGTHEVSATPTPEPTYEPIPLVVASPYPSATPTPTIKQAPTTFPSVKPIPTFPPNPSTTTSDNERVNCLYSDKCGGKKETTVAECNSTLCCSIGGVYKVASVNDCYAEQNRLNKEAYTKLLEEKNQEYKDSLARQEALNKVNEEADRTAQEEAYRDTLEANTTSYNSCVAEVQAWYGREQNKWGAMGTIDSYGSGSFQEQVVMPYKSYMSRCDATYQPRN